MKDITLHDFGNDMAAVIRRRGQAAGRRRHGYRQLGGAHHGRTTPSWCAAW